MSISPLVPVPDLPYRFGRMTMQDGGWIEYDGDLGGHAPEPIVVVQAAAALLAAAGCVTHRVIDLGGPLPAVNQNRIELTTLDGQGITVVWDGEYAERPGDVLRDIRHGLALLEHQAAAPRHDPAEVEAVARALYEDSDWTYEGGWEGEAGQRNRPRWLASAEAVLGALETARANRG